LKIVLQMVLRIGNEEWLCQLLSRFDASLLCSIADLLKSRRTAKYGPAKSGLLLFKFKLLVEMAVQYASKKSGVPAADSCRMQGAYPSAPFF
jgi:hypothetical protein